MQVLLIMCQKYQQSVLQRNSYKNGFSTTFVIIIFFVAAVSVLAGVLTIKHILYNYSPSEKTVDRLISKGKLKEAKVLVYKTHEQSSKVNILKAKVHIALSLKEHADTQWRKFGVNPENWLDDNNSTLAVDLLRDAITLDPSSSLAHCLLGIVLKEMGKLNEAEKMLITARNLDPSSVDSYLALSSLYALQSRYTEAEKVLKAAYADHPENPYIMKNLGFLYRFHIHKPESSIVWLNKYLSNSFSGDRDIGLAKREFRELIQRYPEVGEIDTSPWGSKRNFKPHTKLPF